MNTTKLPCNVQNVFALIDTEDLTEVLRHSERWWLNAGYFYALSSRLKKPIALHKVIMKVKKGNCVDHINRDTLDNRKVNLREVTRSENALNTTKRINSSSRFKGVSWDKFERKWKAYFKTKQLGRFDTEEKAALAYNQAVKAEGVEKFCNLNNV